MSAPFAKSSSMIAFLFLALLALSSMVHSRPIMTGEETSPSKPLSARAPNPRFIQPNTNGLISDLLASLSLLNLDSLKSDDKADAATASASASSAPSAVSSPSPSPSSSKAISTPTPTSTPTPSSNNVSNTVVQAASKTTGATIDTTKFVHDLLTSLSKNFKVQLDDSDEITL